MDRIYHARVVWYHYIYLFLLLAMAIFFLCEKQFILGMIFMVWLIYVLEKILHTFYTITPDRTLVISQGWFIKKKIIKIDEITSIDETFMLKVSGLAVTRFLLLKHKNRYYSLLPDKEVELLELLTKKEG